MIVSGSVHFLSPGRLARLLGVGGTLVTTVGGLLPTIGAGVAPPAVCARPPFAWVLLVAVTGTAWVAASIASLALDWWDDTTTAGTVWTVLQAVPVSLLTVLQLAALRAGA
ncbi:hypothetical protein AB0A94_31865 [Streptomyces sp. NPDC044984]|uniref:hypothetical protein n=1 Tax=Streptomyces sp. NPDC044984 TaxID=3154335 RepID=UPI0033E372EA